LEQLVERPVGNREALGSKSDFFLKKKFMKIPVRPYKLKKFMLIRKSNQKYLQMMNLMQKFQLRNLN